ncbi:MAG: hypothetical protein H6739_20980 [Alphaproteobacteria bacterium]|nr:hypothetical protein [Alphaproteobacteria bacterium]
MADNLYAPPDARLEEPAARSLATGEVLHHAAWLAGRYWQAVLLPSLLVFGPIEVVHGLGLWVARAEAVNLVESLTNLASGLGAALVAPWMFIGVTQMERSGEPLDLRAALDRAAKLLPAVFGARLLVGLLVGLGSLLLVVPGMVLWTRYSLTDPVVTLEGCGAFDALKRSEALVAGRGWAVFRAVLSASVVVFCFAFLVTMLTELAGLIALTMMAGMLTSLAGLYPVLVVLVLYQRLSEPA